MACNHILSRLPKAPRNASYAPEVETTGALNKKCKQSPMREQSALVNQHIRIQQSPVEINENKDEQIYRISDNEQDEDSDCVEIKLPPQTERSRSLSIIPDRLQGLV